MKECPLEAVHPSSRIRHGFWDLLSCYGCVRIRFAHILHRHISLALGQSYDFPRSGETTKTKPGKYIVWIHKNCQYKTFVTEKITSKPGANSWDILLYVPPHYGDAIMSAMTVQILSPSVVYSTVYSGADQRKHQSSASLAFVRVIHPWPVNSAFPAQRASNAENSSIWWHHHV